MTRDYIYLETTPAGTPDAFLDGGTLYLDLPEDFSFQMTAKLGQINDINQLQGSGVLDFSIPMTDKNRWVFFEYLSPNTEDRVFVPLGVRCFGGSVMATPQDAMFFKGATETEIEVSLVESDDFWLTLIQDMLLKEIDCGTFLLNETNLKNNWNEWISFEGSNRRVWFPLVHYGKFWRSQDQFVGVVIEDFLPWFSMRHLLVQGLRQKGWTLDSPLFSENWFQRLWVDVTATDIDYVGKGSQYRVVAESTSDKVFDWETIGGVFYRTFVFQQENIDLSNSHQLVQVPGYPGITSLFYNLSEIDTDFQVAVNITMRNDDANSLPVKFDIVAWSFDTNTALGGVYNLQLEDTDEHDFELNFNFNLAHLQSFGFMIQNVARIGPDPAPFPSGRVVMLSGGTLDIRPSSSRLYRADNITLNQIIDPGHTYLNFFKGVVHLFSGKFYTDFGTRTVWLYPSEDTDLYGSIVEGFLKPPAEAIDVTEHIVQGSKRVVVGESDRARYYRIQFKKSGDPYITTKLGISEEEALYSKLVDVGRGDDTEVKVLENPFFEPTADITWNSLRIPAVWDNVDGNRTRRHGARVTMAVGNYRQGLSNDPALQTPVYWTFEYISRNFFPQASQLPERAFFNALSTWVNTDESIVYGGALDGNDSLYDQFWRHEILVRQFSKAFEFLMFADEALFINLDFRNRLVINYQEDKGLYRLIEKADFRTSSMLPMIIRLKPEPSKLKEKY